MVDDLFNIYCIQLYQMDGLFDSSDYKYEVIVGSSNSSDS